MMNRLQKLLSTSTCAATTRRAVRRAVRAVRPPRAEHLRHGEAVQADPIKPTSKAPGTKRLKLKYNKLLSSLAFNLNSRRYITVDGRVTFIDNDQAYGRGWRRCAAGA